MKGKTTDSLKSLLTKSPSEFGYWKLNEMPGSGECLKQKHQFLNSEVKQYDETISNKQSQNRRADNQIGEITYTRGCYSKCVHMRTRGREV